MQKIKMYLNNLQIIGEILATIIVIVIPIINDYRFVSVGWFLIALTCMGDAIFTKKWGIIGRTWNYKDDEDYKKQLTKKYSDKIFLIIGILGIVLCPIAFFETIFSQNYIAMVGAYLLSTIILILLYIFTDKESKEVAKMIPKIRK